MLATEDLETESAEDYMRIADRAADVRSRGPFLLPAIYTPALSDRFPSDGPRLRAFVDAAWKTPESPEGITLDKWQSWLIDRVLERYPEDYPDPTKAGRLRYRQVVISMPRQNGKSVLGAIFALYGLLMHEPGPFVIGVASTAEQARIVYGRVLYVVQSNPLLSSRFAKMTETRGIKTKDGTGEYQIRASKGDVLQGIPVSLPIVDELHITKPAVWNSLVKGTTTKKNGLVVGITTAGDDDSELLKFLYDLGSKSADLEPAQERFGFFAWQSPAETVPEDDADLAEAILLASPGHYEGRIELGTAITDARSTPDNDVIRYTFNRFVASQSVFIPSERWIQGFRDAPFPTKAGVTFSIDRTPDWGYATITANARQGEFVHSEVAASIVRPTLEGLADLCSRLADLHSEYSTFVVDGYSLRDLGAELKRRGIRCHVATQGDMITASSLLYSMIIRGMLKHSGDEILARQIPHAVRKNVGDGFRISRKDSAVSIDAVISTALGVFGVETVSPVPLQIF